MNLQEINVLVLKNVLKWHVIILGDGSEVWTDEKGEIVTRRYDFSPTTRIQDAWVVVEKMKEKGHRTILNMASKEYIEVILGNIEEGDWHCNMSTGSMEGGTYKPCRAHAESASLAICLAALKAVGVEV